MLVKIVTYISQTNYLNHIKSYPKLNLIVTFIELIIIILNKY